MDEGDNVIGREDEGNPGPVPQDVVQAQGHPAGFDVVHQNVQAVGLELRHQVIPPFGRYPAVDPGRFPQRAPHALAAFIETHEQGHREPVADILPDHRGHRFHQRPFAGLPRPQAQIAPQGQHLAGVGVLALQAGNRRLSFLEHGLDFVGGITEHRKHPDFRLRRRVPEVLQTDPAPAGGEQPVVDLGQHGRILVPFPRAALGLAGAPVADQEPVPIGPSVMQADNAASEPELQRGQGDGGAGADDRNRLTDSGGETFHREGPFVPAILHFVEDERQVLRRLEAEDSRAVPGGNMGAETAPHPFIRF